MYGHLLSPQVLHIIASSMLLIQPASTGQLPPTPPLPSDHPQCGLPYERLDDAWRSVNSPVQGVRRGDRPSEDPKCNLHTSTGVGGDRWYRFTGTDDALPVRSPGGYKCGTGAAGWLTGWNSTLKGAPIHKNNLPGQYPKLGAGIVKGTVCFAAGEPCVSHQTIEMVRCRNFYLFRLPFTANCWSAYCSAPSGMRNTGKKEL